MNDRTDRPRRAEPGAAGDPTILEIATRLACAGLGRVKNREAFDRLHTESVELAMRLVRASRMHVVRDESGKERATLVPRADGFYLMSITRQTRVDESLVRSIAEAEKALGIRS